MSIIEDFKAQSAIEYLMTYGWMLLVVAVVGGAIFSAVGEETLVEVSGFDGEDVQVEDFAFSETGNLRFSIESFDSEQVTIQEISLEDEENTISWTGDLDLGSIGSNEIIHISGVEEAENAQILDLDITYDSGSLEDLSVSGEIQGTLEIEDDVNILASKPEDLQSIYEDLEGQGEEGEPYQINDVGELQAIEENTGEGTYYELEKDIHAIGTHYWNNGKGFDPIEDFEGSFSGLENEIKDLEINLPNTNTVGLFSDTGSDAVVTDIGVVNADVVGKDNTGVLIGRNRGEVSSSYASGGSVVKENSGGLVGRNTGSIHYSFANVDLNIQNSGRTRAGGVVGLNSGEVNNSYSFGDVDPNDDAERVGGFVGQNWNGGLIENSYSTGFVDQGGQNIGGFLGEDRPEGTDNNNYWDVEESGQSSSDGAAIALNTEDMQGSGGPSNMENMDFINTWDTVEDDYPILQSIGEEVQLDAR